MDIFHDIKNKFDLSRADKDKLVNVDNDLTNKVYPQTFEVMNIGHKEYQVLKEALKNTVVEIAKETLKENKQSEKVLKAVIPPEFIEGFKNGKFKFMAANDGGILPNIVDSKNRIVKKVRLEEVELTPKNYDVINQLNNKLLNQKIDAVAEQLDHLIEVTEAIHQGLINKLQGEVNGAVRTIRNSYLDEDENRREQLQIIAESDLNKSIEVLKKEIQDGIDYFANWENRIKVFNKYSPNRLQKKYNKLLEDYLYISKAKDSLIKLKRSQGMSQDNLLEMTKHLEDIDKQLLEVNISGWLPPKTKENSWQHEIVNQLKFNNTRIVITYNVEELLEGEESLQGE